MRCGRSLASLRWHDHREHTRVLTTDVTGRATSRPNPCRLHKLYRIPSTTPSTSIRARSESA
jgi:hypothetical protein